MSLMENQKVVGKLTVTVFDSEGKVKRHSRNVLQKFFGLPGWRMISINHNIVTDQGDALIADLLSDSPARQKLDNINGKIAVGTGWTGISPKTNTGCNSPVGTAESMDSTYPKVKGTFGAANDNIVQYRVTYEAGDLDASGINEAALHNGTDNLAYAEISPSVSVSLTDTLQVDWELTFLGT